MKRRLLTGKARNHPESGGSGGVVRKAGPAPNGGRPRERRNVTSAGTFALRGARLGPQVELLNAEHERENSSPRNILLRKAVGFCPPGIEGAC